MLQFLMRGRYKQEEHLCQLLRIQRQEGKYLRVVMWGQQEIMKGETEYKIKGTLHRGVFRSAEKDL